MKKIVLFIFLSFILSGCNNIPSVKFIWPKTEQDKQIELLEKQKNDVENKYNDLINQKNLEIKESQENRISQGGAQAVASLGTLKADPEPSKYVNAAKAGLEVTELALTDFIEPKDLLEAIKNQHKLISDLAADRDQAYQELNRKKEELLQIKQIENDLKNNIETIEKEKSLIIKEKEDELIKLSKERDEIRQNHIDLIAAKAQEYDKEHSLKNRILSPFKNFFNSIATIFWIIIIGFLLGLILKVLSIIFPGVNIFRLIGKTIGSVVGGIFKLIPDALDGAGAVKRELYEKERALSSNAIGAIQEFKDENIDIYKNKMKLKLDDWFKDTDPELIKEVDKRLKELNLK